MSPSSRQHSLQTRMGTSPIPTMLFARLSDVEVCAGVRQDRRQRKSPRLPRYDYAWPGAYFVTICVADRMPRFGEVVEQRACLNGAGEMIDRHWRSIPERFPQVSLDAYVLMPNHLHGILLINTTDKAGADSLSAILGAFKSLTTREYSDGVRRGLWPRYERRLWQASFYDHVIRNERDLQRVCDYIAANPARWHEDREYRAWQQALLRQTTLAQDDNPA